MHAVNVKTLARNRRLRFFPFHILIERSERQHQQLYLYEWKRRIRGFFLLLLRSLARIYCARRKECVLDDEYISHMHGKQDVCRCAIPRSACQLYYCWNERSARSLTALVCRVCVYRRMGCCFFVVPFGECVTFRSVVRAAQEKVARARMCMRNGCVR